MNRARWWIGLIIIHVIVIGGLALSGCSTIDAWRGIITKEIRDGKDTEARILIDSVGAMGLAAWGRLKSPNEKCGALLLANIPCDKAPDVTIKIAPITLPTSNEVPE